MNDLPAMKMVAVAFAVADAAHLRGDARLGSFSSAAGALSGDARLGPIRVMARYQLGREIPEPEIRAIAAFLETLTGDLRSAL